MNVGTEEYFRKSLIKTENNWRKITIFNVEVCKQSFIILKSKVIKYNFLTQFSFELKQEEKILIPGTVLSNTKWCWNAR